MPIAITASKRDVKAKKAKHLRNEGSTPAVLYGQGIDNIHLCLPTKALEAALHTDDHVFDLDIDGDKHAAIVKDIDRDYLKDIINHVDFLKIKYGEKVKVVVSIKLIGEAAGLKDGGVLNQAMHDIEIDALPSKIPETIDVDISALNVGESIRFSDITAPESVTFEENDLGRIIVSIAEAKGEKEEKEAAEPEVIGEVKQDDDDKGDK